MAETGASFQYSEDQRDCLQEICNVAVGQVGDSLARKLGVFVTLPIPVISIIPAEQLSTSLNNFTSSSGIYAASQLFASASDGCELSGLALVMLSEDSLDDLKELIPDPGSSDNLVIDTCRQMAQTCLDALSAQWGLGFQSDSPQLVGHKSLSTVCENLVTGWNNILVVEINYHLEGRDFNSDLLLLFPDEAIAAMALRLDDLLA
jgi:chemotaxis protein CheY-P-specific phosphatase CheC